MTDELDYTVFSQTWPELEKREGMIDEVMICGPAGEYAIRWFDLGTHVGLKFEIFSDGIDTFMDKRNLELVWNVNERSKALPSHDALPVAAVVEICTMVGIVPSVYQQRRVTDRAEADAEGRQN